MNAGMNARPSMSYNKCQQQLQCIQHVSVAYALLATLCHVLGHLVSFLLDLLNVTNHVEGHLWKVIVLALHDTFESLDGVSDFDILACIKT